MSTSCAKCGSTEVVPDATLWDQGQYSDGTLKAAYEQNPGAWLFKGRVFAELRATICGACGHVELRAKNPRALYEAFCPPTEEELERRKPRKKRLSDNHCLRCGTAMADDAVTCAACGWTYDDEATA